MTVTSASDEINGDVRSWASLLENPGRDGISLREALTVANLLPGPKRITFDASLSGSVIYQSADPHKALPALISGDLTLDGDINHDGNPDITLDGSKGTPGNPTAVGIIVWSSNNQVNGLRIQNFANRNLALTSYWPEGAKSVSGNRFTNNQIPNQDIFVGLLGPQFNDFTIEDTVIAGNTIHATETGISIAFGGGASRNKIIGLVIDGNIITGAHILIATADTDSTWHGQYPPPAVYSEENLIQDTLIQNNQISGAYYDGIHLLTANLGNSRNRISRLTIRANTIVGAPNGIHITAAEGGGVRSTRDNLVEYVLVEDNLIEDSEYGIFLSAAEKQGLGSEFGDFLGNRVNQVVIRRNIIRDYTLVGIEVLGGRSNNASQPTQDNHVAWLEISSNILSTSRRDSVAGMFLAGGLTLDERQVQYSGPARQNSLETVTIDCNRLSGGETTILVIGGRGPGADDNHVLGLSLTENELESPPQVMDNQYGANGNSVEMMRGSP